MDYNNKLLQTLKNLQRKSIYFLKVQILGTKFIQSSTTSLKQAYVTSQEVGDLYNWSKVIEEDMHKLVEKRKAKAAEAEKKIQLL